MKKTFFIPLFLFLMATISFLDVHAQPVQQSLNTHWKFKQARLTQWHPAQVPGVIHTDLLANGSIEDPFYRLNERGLQWIDKEDWIYETTFTPSEKLFQQQRIRLVCKGLDTYADVYLNGEKILVANNMFRSWETPIKKRLKKGENTLRIYFHSPIKHDYKLWDKLPAPYEAGNDQSENGGIFDKKLSVFARKAGYHYGWDWGPRLVTSGIWRPIYIEGWSDTRITDVYFQQPYVTAKRADLKAQVRLESEATGQAEVLIKEVDTGKTLAVQTVDLQKGEQTLTLPFTLHRPQLWWSHGWGKPHRYTFKTVVNINRKTIDVKEHKIGVRSLKLVRKKDQWGRSFYFELNGTPLFCKGANYIPQDNFLPRVTKAQYKETILVAVKANMNMLRVWGGGIYEKDLFYDLCDEYGILVWQDFMFACSLYPAEGALLENIRQEAKENVIRLRNHACIALWCGNNECQDAWYQWEWKKKYEKKGVADILWKQFEDLYFNTLPEVVKTYAPRTTYTPSSPFAAKEHGSNDHDGDRHYWDVWHSGKPTSAYNTARSRFFSEYGFQSFPEWISVKQYAPKAKDWDIYSEVMMAHQRGGTYANRRIEEYLKKEYRMPTDFQRVLYFNQVLQGDAIKTAMEAHRRDRPYCMGSLFWQHNDCWPVASWSSRDYYGRWKAQHYFARKAYDDILVSPIVQEGKLKVYIVNDRRKKTKGKLSLQVLNLSGGIVNQHQQRIHVPANTSHISMEYAVDKLLKGKSKAEVVIHVRFTDKQGKVYTNNYVLLKQKEMHYPTVQLTSSIAPLEKGTFALTVKADKFARAVFLQIDDLKSSYSDNYFDVLPGETHRILIETKLSLAALQKNLKIQSLAAEQ